MKYVYFVLIFSEVAYASKISTQTLEIERQKAWKFTQAECAVLPKESVQLYDRYRITGSGALPRHIKPEMETNLNCFEPELICINAFNYCDSTKASTVQWIESSSKTKEIKKLNANCELTAKYGLILHAKIPARIFSGEGYFEINKLYYEGDSFYSKDKHYYRAVIGE